MRDDRRTGFGSGKLVCEKLVTPSGSAAPRVTTREAWYVAGTLAVRAHVIDAQDALGLGAMQRQALPAQRRFRAAVALRAAGSRRRRPSLVLRLGAALVWGPRVGNGWWRRRVCRTSNYLPDWSSPLWFRGVSRDPCVESSLLKEAIFDPAK